MRRLLLLAAAAALAAGMGSAHAVPTTALYLSMDGSGSISAGDFATQINGYVSALNTFFGANPSAYGQVAIGGNIFGANVSQFFAIDTIDNAADLALLGDAALCAEKVGVTLEDRDETFGNAASPGWRWVEAVLSDNRRRVPPDKILDKVATKLRVDRRAFATCRAQLAGTSIAWIEAARRAGVRVTPSTVVGGRIYGPIVDQNTLQLLVEAELAPGILGEAAPSWRGTESVR